MRLANKKKVLKIKYFQDYQLIDIKKNEGNNIDEDNYKWYNKWFYENYEPLKFNWRVLYLFIIELIVVRGVYFMYFYIINKNRYGRIRNLFGSEAVSVEYAYNNALRVINFEKFFGFFIEEKIQVYLQKI